MGIVSNKIASWAALEDEDLYKKMIKLYGPLLELGMLFPKWKGRINIQRTLLLLLFYLVAAGAHFYLLTESVILLRDEIALASLAFNVWMILFFVITAPFFVNLHRKALAGINRSIGENLGKYRSCNIYLESKPLEYEKNKRKELMQFLVLPGLVVALAGGILIVPYIKKLSREKSGDEAHYNSRGVNLNLPIAARYPFPTHSGVGHGVAVLGQLAAGGALVVLLVTMELFFFRVSQMVIFEFNVLNYSIDTIFIRAGKLYDRTHPELVHQEKSKSNYHFQRSISQCLEESVIHHHEIMSIISRFETIVSVPCLLAYGLGAGVIALSLVNIQLARETDNIENIVLFFLLSICGCLNMYLISKLGEDITTVSEVMRDKLYFIDWLELDVSNRKILLNFMVGANEAVIVKAGGITALCLDTFSSIINTAYSFFNLMSANRA